MASRWAWRRASPRWLGAHPADITVNAPNVLWFRGQYDPILTDQQVLDALQRLVMHEAGHAIGLGHPTIDPVNFDTVLHGDDAGGRDALYPVPEPSTLLLVLAGAALLAARRQVV